MNHRACVTALLLAALAGAPGSALAKGKSAELAPAAQPAEKAEQPAAAEKKDEKKDEKGLAKIHFQAGAAFYRESRYEDAIREFTDAYTYDPNPVLLFNVAQAHEKLNRISEALRFYRRYLHEAPQASDRKTVEISVRNLEARLAEQGVQQVQIYSQPQGASVVIDGKVLGPTPLAAELKPGKHHLAVSLAGHKTVERDFGLAQGRALDIDVTLESGSGTVQADFIGDMPLPPLVAEQPAAPATTQPAAVAAATQQAPVAPPKPALWQQLRGRTFAVVGAAAVLALVGGGFQMSKSSIESQAATETVQTRYVDLSHSAQSRVTASRVAFGAAGLAALTGGGLVLVDLGTF